MLWHRITRRIFEVNEERSEEDIFPIIIRCIRNIGGKGHVESLHGAV